MALLTVLLALAGDNALKRGRTLDWLATGGALGLFTLGKETGTALLAAAALAALWTWRRQPRRAARAVGLMLAGWLLVCSPALVRNRLVDASTFKLSTRGPEVFVTGNAKGQDGVGWEPPTGTLRRILMDSNFQLLPTVAATLATHRAEPWGYVELLWNKTRAFFNAYEEPNNVNFELHRAHLPTLRLGFVSMWFLAPAALLGLLLGLPRRRELAVPYLLFLALTLSVIALYILGRFRLQVLPLMALFAALAVDWAWRKLRERRTGPLVAGALAFLVLLGWTRRPDEPKPFTDQSRDGAMVFQLVKAGNYERALVFLDRLRRMKSTPEGVITDKNLADKLDTMAAAFPLFEQAMAWPEDSAERHLYTGRGLVTMLPITEHGERREFTGLARAEFQAVLESDPSMPGAHLGLGHVAVLDDDPGLGYAEFSQEIELHPDSAEAHLGIGALQRFFGQGVEALRHFRAALASGIEDGRMLAWTAYIEIDPTLK
ncbi:MAG TPA: glycosyltransferase family 39 protein, partial [Planctomycetota bacterium]|nr:glycosyltransferase family 39 protein [Planctomycetota bacterium]